MDKKNNIKVLFSVFAIIIISSFMLSACTTLSDFFSSVNFDSGQGTTTDPDQPDTELPVWVDEDELTVDNAVNFDIDNVVVTSSAMTWQEVEDEQQLYAVYYSNDIEPTIVEVNQDGFSLPQEVIDEDDIIVFRVGTKDEQDVYTLSQEYYYNPENYAGYTDVIYNFDGEVRDYYIESQEELNNLMHYSYISRLQDFTVRISSGYKSVISSNGGLENGLTQALTTAVYSFYETILAQPSYSYVNNYNGLTLDISWDYKGARYPTESLSQDIIQDLDYAPYYESYEVKDYTDRSETYDDFATDKKLELITVDNSEELYWAVESGATPVFEDTNSTAYQIYNKAKEVLTDIIKVEMTDYEKALSIFDYIVYNTIYDWKIVESDEQVLESYIGNNELTNYTSFFIEGVLNDGVAVCDGFSKTFSLLANMEGINAVRIVGTINGIASGGHAWNKVQLDGNWYVVDATWTEVLKDHYAIAFDSSYQGQEVETLSHRYFLVNDDYISSTHTTHESNTYKDYEAPDNYYIFENATHSTFSYNGQVYDFVLESSEEVEVFVNYLYDLYTDQQYQTKAYEVVVAVDMEVYNTAISTAKSERGFNNDVLSSPATTAVYPYAENETGTLVVLIIKDTTYVVDNR